MFSKHEINNNVHTRIINKFPKVYYFFLLIIEFLLKMDFHN